MECSLKEWLRIGQILRRMRESHEDVVMIVLGKYFLLSDCVNCETFSVTYISRLRSPFWCITFNNPHFMLAHLYQPFFRLQRRITLVLEILIC